MPLVPGLWEQTPFTLSPRAESYLLRLSPGEQEVVKDQLLHRLVDTKQIGPEQNKEANYILVIQSKILLRESLTAEEEAFKSKLDRPVWLVPLIAGIGFLALVAFLRGR